MAKLSDIPRLVRQALESKDILHAGARAMERAIPKRTRLGHGVKENLGPTHKLPELKAKTKTNRQALKRAGELTGPGATPAKSGLNKSGTLLNSIEIKVTNKNIEVSLPPDQEKKADHLLKINPDYQFMRLSAAEFKRVLRAMTKQVEQVLKRIKFTDL